MVKPAETVNLTMEQRHIIKEIIIKDMKITEPQDQAAKVPTQVGETVPAAFRCSRCRSRSRPRCRSSRPHSFLVKNDKVVIIDPKDNKVAALVE